MHNSSVDISNVLLAMIEERNAVARRIESLTACVTSAKFADLPDHDLISAHLHWAVGLHAVLVSRVLRLSKEWKSDDIFGRQE